jgi:hypothetical protein
MNAAATFQPVAHPFCGDETIRWSCRRGEYVLWVGVDSLFTADLPSSWKIRDFWQMRDGDFITITNRWPDLPAWFRLHPSEVAGAATFEMQRRMSAGEQPAAETMDCANIWRVKAGDRLAWVSAEDARQIKDLVDFHESALALGENASLSFESFAFFGAPEGKKLPPPDAAAMRAGFDAAVALGVPDDFAVEWRFGA